MSGGLSPVRLQDGQYRAHHPQQGWQPIIDAGRPVDRLVHGWEPVGLYRGFDPVLLLELRHDAGQQATWFLDPSLNRIGDDLGRLPPEMREAMRRAVLPALRRLCSTLLTGNPDADPPDPLGLHALNLATISSLIDLAGEALTMAPVTISLDRIPADQRDVVVAGWRLSVRALRACLAPVMQEQHMAVLAGGDYEATCPFTGTMLRTRTTFLDERTGACRFESPAIGQAPGFIFYLCNNSAITDRELFIPALNCTIAMPAPELGRGLFRRLLAMVVRHADLLPAYLARPKRPATILTAYPGLHVGHVLWNELTGLDRVRRTLPPDDLPDVIVPNAELGTEVFGPVERILPAFTGKVRRLPSGVIPGIVYRDALVAMHVYDRRVSRALAERIGQVADADPAVRPDHGRAAACHAEGRTVILIGLRVQNRTVPDPGIFWRDAIDHLCHRLGPITLVVDGVNARLDADPSTDYSSFGPQTGRPPVLDELEIVIRMRRQFHDDRVRIINTVGAPIARSLFWARQAAFFVALWGAGLAKYRWVANKPGLVLTNRANLRKMDGELGIYHSPAMMEAPTPLDFIDAEHVTDLPAPNGFYSDFTVDPAALCLALDRLIARLGLPASRTPACLPPPVML